VIPPLRSPTAARPQDSKAIFGRTRVSGITIKTNPSAILIHWFIWVFGNWILKRLLFLIEFSHKYLNRKPVFFGYGK